MSKGYLQHAEIFSAEMWCCCVRLPGYLCTGQSCLQAALTTSTGVRRRVDDRQLTWQMPQVLTSAYLLVVAAVLVNRRTNSRCLSCATEPASHGLHALRPGRH